MTRGRWIAFASAVVLGIVGLACVAAAIVISSAPRAEDVTATAKPTAPAPVPTVGSSTEVGAEEDEPEIGEIRVAELASPAWVIRVSQVTGIPERALSAYGGAALAVGQSDPTCGIGWNTIAAIGLVETEHGSMNGATLGSDGDVEPAIVGIALDGVGVEAIADTDDGALDGDTLWDRAVGPMQFIPSTWRSVGRDGNGDGVVSINNIDDTAYSAALHLCEVGGDLRSSANWISAVSAYNSSVEYNNRVAAAATTYSELR